MAAFPYFNLAAIEALDNQAVAILNCFAARGYARQEPSVLQPADIFLDRSGEEIRRSNFKLTNPSGRELCRRTEMTIQN
jgi:ATP phosphoribosyltransferase regulatory subunit